MSIDLSVHLLANLVISRLCCHFRSSWRTQLLIHYGTLCQLKAQGVGLLDQTNGFQYWVLVRLADQTRAYTDFIHRCLYIIAFLTVSVPFALQARVFTRAVDTMDTFLGAIQVSEQAWTEGQKFAFQRELVLCRISLMLMSVPAQWLLLVTEVTDRFNKYRAWSRAAFQCFLAVVITVTLVGQTLFPNLS